MNLMKQQFVMGCGRKRNYDSSIRKVTFGSGIVSKVRDSLRRFGGNRLLIFGLKGL